MINDGTFSVRVSFLYEYYCCTSTARMYQRYIRWIQKQSVDVASVQTMNRSILPKSLIPFRLRPSSCDECTCRLEAIVIAGRLCSSSTETRVLGNNGLSPLVLPGVVAFRFFVSSFTSYDMFFQVGPKKKLASVFRIVFHLYHTEGNNRPHTYTQINTNPIFPPCFHMMVYSGCDQKPKQAALFVTTHSSQEQSRRIKIKI